MGKINIKIQGSEIQIDFEDINANDALAALITCLSRTGAKFVRNLVKDGMVPEEFKEEFAEKIGAEVTLQIKSVLDEE